MELGNEKSPSNVTKSQKTRKKRTRRRSEFSISTCAGHEIYYEYPERLYKFAEDNINGIKVNSLMNTGSKLIFLSQTIYVNKNPGKFILFVSLLCSSFMTIVKSELTILWVTYNVKSIRFRSLLFFCSE